MIKKLISGVGLFLLCSGISMSQGIKCYPGLDCPEDITSTKKSSLPNHELNYWKETKKCNQPLCYQNFLNRYPNGKYANLARSKLKSPEIVEEKENNYTLSTKKLANLLSNLSEGKITVQQLKLLLSTNRKSMGYSVSIFPEKMQFC